MAYRRIRNLAVTGITIASATGLTILSAVGASAAATAANPRHVAAVARATAAPAASATSLPLGVAIGIFANEADTNPAYSLHAHAHNEVVDTSNNPAEFQVWDFIRPKYCIANLSDKCQFAVEIQLAATGQCLNAQNALDGVQVWLDSCSSTYDQNEYFWPTDLGPGNNSGENWWFINVYDSLHYHQYEYLTTPFGLGDGDPVLDYPAGSGIAAVWDVVGG